MCKKPCFYTEIENNILNNFSSQNEFMFAISNIVVHFVMTVKFLRNNVMI